MSATERVTITLNADVVESIDRMERSRSQFIAEAVEHELARRRREVFLCSVHSPHAGTAERVDVGVSDWTADLPGDEGLVDIAAGTPVRWVEGHGWIEERA